MCFPASSALKQCSRVNPDSIAQLSLVLNLPFILLFFSIVLLASNPESKLFQPVRHTPINLVQPYHISAFDLNDYTQMAQDLLDLPAEIFQIIMYIVDVGFGIPGAAEAHAVTARIQTW
jgi:hypothetical protein